MYQFINALSHTTSILIMVVMCVERHLAILHPFHSKQLLTIRRLRIIIIAVWIVSAIYCSPRLYYIVTLKVYKMDGGIEIICTAKRTLYDSRTFDMVHFFLLFLLPLLIISILYTRVGITLWRTSKNNRMSWASGSGAVGGGGGAGNTESNPSHSSSETLNDESPTTTTTTSTTIGPRNSSIRRHKSLHFRSTSNSSTSSSINGGPPSRVPSSCPTKSGSSELPGSRLQHVLRRSNTSTGSTLLRGKKNNVRKASPSFVVTIENKCHVVGPEETTVVEIDPDAIVCNGGAVGEDGDEHQRRLHLATSSCSSLPRTTSNSNSSDRPGAKPINSVVINNNNSFRRDEPALGQGTSSMRRTKSCKRLSTAKNLRDGREAIRSRQTVVRMLIVIVATFAVCNFPFHLRKMFQYWWPNYDYVSIYSTLATPLTHLIMYANCAINPIIYAFMSKTFRSSFKDLLCCRWKKEFQSTNQRQLSVRGVSVIGDDQD